VTTRRLLRADDPAEARIATGGATLVLEPVQSSSSAGHQAFQPEAWLNLIT
jgi:hypothetical protein